jgi:predicted MFS family arabinose efflux permease
VFLTTIGIALACGPLGYLLGLALLVPLVDRFPPSRVVATQFGAYFIGGTLGTAFGAAAVGWFGWPATAAIAASAIALAMIVTGGARPDRRSLG